MRLSVNDLRNHLRPARLGTLTEQCNSHYAARPVMVLLNHGVGSNRPWDPLYTALGLGNVTLVANPTTLRIAEERLAIVMQATLPEVPPVWTALMAGMAGP